MPNINLNEKDTSNYSDQQFIKIAYNGSVNLNKYMPETLNYTVKFIFDNDLYYMVSVTENQKISAPPIAPIKEGYTFKHWDLNDEEFDFNTIINDNIILKAKFEETPISEHLFEKELSYVGEEHVNATVDNIEDLADFVNAFDAEKNYRIKIGDTVEGTGKFTFDDSEGVEMYFMQYEGESETEGFNIYYIPAGAEGIYMMINTSMTEPATLLTIIDEAE